MPEAGGNFNAAKDLSADRALISVPVLSLPWQTLDLIALYGLPANPDDF